MLLDTGAALLDAVAAYANPNSAYAAQGLAQAATITPESWWAGVTDPYTSRWDSGDQAGAAGYVVGAVVLTVLLMKGVGRVLKLGTVGGGVTETVADAPVATANVTKFSDYLFKEGATHGKAPVFGRYGYFGVDSERLAAIYEQ